MFCPNCGSQNTDGCAFCASCGSKLPNVQKPTPESAAPPAWQESPAPPAWQEPAAPPAWQEPPAPPAPSAWQAPTAPRIPTANVPGAMSWQDTFRARWRGLATAPLFLTITICYTLIQLLTLIGIGSSSYFDSIYQTLGAMGVSAYEIRSVLGEFESALDSVQFAAMVPGILVTISLWLIYFNGRDRSNAPLGTAGLTIIQVLEVISLVLVCILLLISVIAIGAAGSILSGYGGYYSSSASDSMAIITVVVLVFFGLIITWFAMVLTIIARMKKAARTCTPEIGPAAFVGVLCILSGAVSLIALLVNGLTLTGILSNVVTILFGVQLFSYKKAMETLKYERNAYQPQNSGYYRGY